MPIDDSKWRFVLTNMDGSPASGGGLVTNAGNKTFTYNLNGGRTCSFVMNIDNPRANFVLDNDARCKVYRKNRLNSWTLMMVGEVIQAQEDGTGDVGLVSVTAADPWFILPFRRLGITLDARGRAIGYTDGTYAADGVTLITQKDIGQMIQDIISYSNADSNTGIALGSLQTSTSTAIGPLFNSNVDQIIQQLASTLGGPDFELAPMEPVGVMPSTQVCTLNVYSHLGSLTNPPPAVFEYGTRRGNVATYSRLVDKTQRANRISSLPQGFPQQGAISDTIVQSIDSASVNSIGARDYILTEDLTSPDLRQELADEYLQVLASPRQQITFTPAVNCPLDFTVDYHVGDVVTARAYDRTTNTWRFNGLARLYGINFVVDENDSETAALTLIPGTV